MKHALSFVMLAVLVSSPYLSTPAHATVYGPLELVAEGKTQYIFEDNRDLGTRDEEKSNNYSTELKLRALYEPTESLSAYWEGRGLYSFGDSGSEDDNGKVSYSERYFEWRQSWVMLDHLAGVYPLSVKMGRQRVRDARSLWWNDDIDAVRLNYDTTLFEGFLAVAENLRSYRSSHEDYREQDKDRLRFMGSGSWLWRKDQTVDVRFHYEKDHSGTEPLGSLVVSDDRDDEDFDLLWTGIRSAGRVPVNRSYMGDMHYRIDAMMVAGEETLLSTTSSSVSGHRQVSGSRTRDVLGWGLDAEMDMNFTIPLEPTFTLGYAFGSGDDDETDGTNNAFRQTDLQGNSSRYGMSSQQIHNYGEAFRPELSNLHIMMAGVGVPVWKASDVSLFYRYYLADEKDSDIRRSRVRTQLNGTDNEVGQEIDLAFNMHLTEELESVAKLPDRTLLRLAVGTFMGGKAYEPEENDNSMWRVLAELRFRF